MREPATISLSLVSHTNAGKTTLARTLLARDIGEVRDAPHVTEFADAHLLAETAQGERLELWDTPGFGDSVRLVRRLRQAARPWGWFLTEVWDRWRDRPFWMSQQALRNVREHADVMLYLVNAAEAPEAAPYVASEMELLAWVGKPVVVLLNQLGAPREASDEEADIVRWRRHLATLPTSSGVVCAVLPLDAFARCWVQELTLWHAIEEVLVGDDRERMARLRAAWLAQRIATFDAAMRSLAHSLARLATQIEPLPREPGLRGGVGSAVGTVVGSVGRAIGRGVDKVGARVGGAERAAAREPALDDSPAGRAQRALAQRLDDELRASTGELIGLHRLRGDAQAEILARLASHYELRLRLDEKKAAVWGGMLTGALVGLKADLLSGGLTLGGGLLAGGVIGALGAAGLARCVNLVRGTEQSSIVWNDEALDQMVEAALLRYLAVAHFGRGRGDWSPGESPPHWREVVAGALAPYREALDAAWALRGAAMSQSGSDAEIDAANALSDALQAVVRGAAIAALHRLYPDVAELWAMPEMLGETA